MMSLRAEGHSLKVVARSLRSALYRFSTCPSVLGCLTTVSWETGVALAIVVRAAMAE